jgi:hypothetical protein
MLLAYLRTVGLTSGGYERGLAHHTVYECMWLALRCWLSLCTIIIRPHLRVHVQPVSNGWVHGTCASCKYVPFARTQPLGTCAVRSAMARIYGTCVVMCSSVSDDLDMWHLTRRRRTRTVSYLVSGGFDEYGTCSCCWVQWAAMT